MLVGLGSPLNVTTLLLRLMRKPRQSGFNLHAEHAVHGTVNNNKRGEESVEERGSLSRNVCVRMCMCERERTINVVDDKRAEAREVVT